MVHACTKSLNKGSKKFFQPFKLPLCGLVVFNSYVYVVFNDTVILTEGGRGFKTFLKEIMQLLWTVVTYLLKNVKHGIEHDIDISFWFVECLFPIDGTFTLANYFRALRNSLCVFFTA